MLRSTYAHARIKSIDTSKAMAVDGVFAVVTADDFPRLPFGGQGTIARDNLAHEKVLYHGHGVAAVAASTRAIARAAADLIEVDYEPLPPVMNLDDALKGDVLLHEEFEEDGKFSNVLRAGNHRDRRRGSRFRGGGRGHRAFVHDADDSPGLHRTVGMSCLL